MALLPTSRSTRFRQTIVVVAGCFVLIALGAGLVAFASSRASTAGPAGPAAITEEVTHA